MGLDRKWRRGEPAQSLKRNRDVKPPKHWKEAEEIGARAHGGEVTKGSGCSWRPDRKLDSVSERWRMSSKTTDKASVRVERGWCEEARRAAQAELHQPALHIGFDPDHRDRREDWIAVPASVFKRINEVLDAVEAGDGEQAIALAALLRRAS